MIRELVQSASTAFPMAAFAFFFTMFISIVAMIARRHKDAYADVSALPLDDEGDAS